MRYRGLLSTAESIIEMDEQMHHVEAYLGDMGRKCNTRLLEKKGTNLLAWNGNIRASGIQIPTDSQLLGALLTSYWAGSERYALTSQLAVFRSCPEVISRLLRTGVSVLLAAKILVISRLLHKKLSQRPRPPPYLDSLRNRLATLRRRLLAKIDNRFKRLDVSDDGLVEAMCAFSLATSSSPTDVLRHFLYARQEAMSEQSHKTSHNHEGVFQALRLYVKTLRDTQALVPGQLARALERLKSVALFKNADLYSLLELNLDIHERWIGDDIKTFTPYIRHDDLQRSEAEKLLRLWAKQAFASFLSDLQDRIQWVDDPLTVLQLRRQILELWLSNSRHLLRIESIEALDGLRDAFNNQFTRIIQRRVASLTEVTLAIQSTLRDWQTGVSDPARSLWASSVTSIETSGGAKLFRKTLLSTINGRTLSLETISAQYTTWLSRISAIEATIKSLQSQNWNDDLDDIDDDYGSLSDKQTLLSSDDPAALQQKLSDSVAAAFDSLEPSLKVPTSTSNEQDRGHVSAYLLRIFKELRHHLPSSYQKPNFGFDSIQNLHELLANAALTTPWQKCERRTRSSYHPGRQLWEGDPELPALPSPWTFRFLKDLVSSMTKFGTDVWSSPAVDMLKQILRRKLATELAKALLSAPEVNGTSAVETNGETEEAKEANGISHPGSTSGPKSLDDLRTQRLFDTQYLMHATNPKNLNKSREAQDDPLGELYLELREGLGLEEESIKKIEMGAKEYWKRTGMLFGLLG